MSVDIVESRRQSRLDNPRRYARIVRDYESTTGGSPEAEMPRIVARRPEVRRTAFKEVKTSKNVSPLPKSPGHRTFRRAVLGVYLV
jgi:hypothetical protein